MGTVFAFECNVRGEKWQKVVHQTTRNRAKVEYWRDVTDAWPEVPYTAITCRKLGAPVQSSEFARVATYRGLPQARIGMRVKAEGMEGVIVGHNSSANFDVLFNGQKSACNVHPHGLELLGE